MNFIYNLSVSYNDVLAAVSGFIEHHGKHLWGLHITSLEIRIALEDSEGNVTPIHGIIENVSGFIVNFRGYQEITTDKRMTILKLIEEKGPLRMDKVDPSRLATTLGQIEGSQQQQEVERSAPDKVPGVIVMS